MLVLAGASAVAGLGPPPAAAAAAPCWREVVDDWFDGRIDGVHAPSCYREALRHLPADARNYTSATGDIQRAMLAAIAAERKPQQPARRANTKTSARQLESVNAPQRAATEQPAATPAVATPVERPLFDRLAALGAGSGSGALPLPIVVLATLGGLLLAAAGGSRAAQRLRRR